MTIDSLHGESLNMILDSLPDGVYITDLERKILYWNKSAEKITGWTKEDVRGTSCYDGILCHVDSGDNLLCGKDDCPLHQAIINNQSNRLPVMVFAKGKQGQRIPVEVTVAPVVDENGDVVGGIESFRDLSSLMDDLQHARSIQLNAMETDIADDPRIQIAVHNIPYEYVSGDFYRVERLTDDSYVMFMADIMGHGVSSALYAMTIRSIWEEARGLLSNPAAFCTHLNEQLFKMTKSDDSFATAVFGIFDLSKMKFNFVRAGHPPPLLHRNGSVVPCGKSNQALGLFLDGDFIADEIDLQLGDRFLVYTDGAIEITNSEGEELEMDGLAKIMLNEQKNISGSEFIKKMETRILEYSNLMTFSDDLTLAEIVIKP